MNKFSSVYIIFPLNYEHIGKDISDSINKSIKINCSSIPYENNDKEILEKIKNSVHENCILVIGYSGELTSHNCYKLGMAYAHGKVVILVDILDRNKLLRDKKAKHIRNPKYVTEHYLIEFWGESGNDTFTWQLETLKKELKYIIRSFLKGDINSILYKRAISMCESLEIWTGCGSLKTIQKNGFQNRLRSYIRELIFSITNKHNSILEDNSIDEIVNQDLLENFYINGQESLDIALLHAVTHNSSKNELTKALQKIKEDTHYKIPAPHSIMNIISNSTVNMPTGDINMNAQFNNNLQGSNIANFANEVQDSARQQANQHIHQGPNQNLT
jgi:hypothetical protein